MAMTKLSDNELRERLEEAGKAFYINLGRGGYLGHKSIKDDCLMIGFPCHLHEEVMKTEDLGSMPDAVQVFYKEEKALWITCWNMRLWWTFAEEEFGTTKDHDNTELKVRGTTGWCDKDLDGEVLYLHRLGYIPRYRGTINPIGRENLEYLKSRIRGAGAGTEEERLIARLDENQLEWFAEKLFCEMGWVRVSPVGGTQKDIDVVMEKKEEDAIAFIEVKSKGSMGNWAEVVRSAYRFSNTGDSEGRKAKFYLVYNKPPSPKEKQLDCRGLGEFMESISDDEPGDKDPKRYNMLQEFYGENRKAGGLLESSASKVSVESWGRKDLAEMAVKHGLSDWLRVQVNGERGKKEGI
ncbi:MAG: hypothetical protein MPJ79_03265 [Alphaproteobacteria bacterium]|nr:hypothetical protein [Alphaproteobacteria bacterium]